MGILRSQELKPEVLEMLTTSQELKPRSNEEERVGVWLGTVTMLVVDSG